MQPFYQYSAHTAPNTTPTKVGRLSEPRPNDSGAKKSDSEKARTDLLPFDALTGVAAVMRYGAAKYEDRNWEKGFSYGRLLGATLRHLFAWASREDNDPESGLSHLAHASASVLMLYATVLRGKGQDDRTKKT